jgi:hypothetical protein
MTWDEEHQRFVHEPGKPDAAVDIKRLFARYGGMVDAAYAALRAYRCTDLDPATCLQQLTFQGLTGAVSFPAGTGTSRSGPTEGFAYAVTQGLAGPADPGGPQIYYAPFAPALAGYVVYSAPGVDVQSFVYARILQTAMTSDCEFRVAGVPHFLSCGGETDAVLYYGEELPPASTVGACPAGNFGVDFVHAASGMTGGQGVYGVTEAFLATCPEGNAFMMALDEMMVTMKDMMPEDGPPDGHDGHSGRDDSRCSSAGDDCCACDASIGQLTCSFMSRPRAATATSR